jgi:multiphosphoryl transfer protein
VISTPGQTTPPRVPVTLSGAPASETVTSSQGVAAGVLRGTPTSPGLGFGPVAPPGAGAAGVVVASEVGPAEVAAFDGAVAALATAGGAPLSHASILARSMGIPAVTGLGPDLLAVPPGTPVLVDGDEGSVRIRPTPAEVDAARARQHAARRRQEERRRHAPAPAVTADGTVVEVMANAGGADDARAAVAEGADGIGMLRTEFAFLGRADPPTEDEQYLAYRAVAAAAGDRPVVVRTLDLGADVPAWDSVAEANPALGNRGLRLALSSPGLLDTQLRAIARLARDRPLRVMFPMVTTVDELHRARAALDAVAPEPGTIEAGITVEVPAAALTATAFAAAVDFFAVGTNDLTQYTLAVDRGNPAVAALADGLHPSVLLLVAEVTSAAAARGLPVCLVGELATDPAAVPVLIGLGVRSLSVRPNAVAAVKEAVRAAAVADAVALADRALRAGSAPAVRALARELRPPAAGGT